MRIISDFFAEIAGYLFICWLISTDLNQKDSTDRPKFCEIVDFVSWEQTPPARMYVPLRLLVYIPLMQEKRIVCNKWILRSMHTFWIWVYGCMSACVCVLCACVLLCVCKHTGMTWCLTRLKSAAVLKITAGKMVARCVPNSNPTHTATYTATQTATKSLGLVGSREALLENGGLVWCSDFKSYITCNITATLTETHTATHTATHTGGWWLGALFRLQILNTLQHHGSTHCNTHCNTHWRMVAWCVV